MELESLTRWGEVPPPGDDALSAEHFGVRFDWVLAFSLFNHVPQLAGEPLARVASLIAPGGRLVVSPRLTDEQVTASGLQLAHTQSRPCKLIHSQIDWFEYRREP